MSPLWAQPTAEGTCFLFGGNYVVFHMADDSKGKISTVWKESKHFGQYILMVDCWKNKFEATKRRLITKEKLKGHCGASLGSACQNNRFNVIDGAFWSFSNQIFNENNYLLQTDNSSFI